MRGEGGPFAGKVFAQRGGLGYAARVVVEVEPGADGIVVACSGPGWARQGAIEQASADGYADWKAGAVAGVAFALRIMGVDCGVRVVLIEGMTTDTNPTIVAAAAARAVWQAIGFTPASELTRRIEAEVLGSWRRGHDASPCFDD